jgi:dTDP-4-dehydrorhamnose reductase
VAPLELWASPEPTFARIDATTVRDQSAETGLDARPDDAERIAALGVSVSRVPVLWERVSPADPHERDYREPERRLDALRAAGVEPIVTLLHHGSGPQYTDLLDPAFPLWFAEYAEATAQQFPWVRRWTPINEPLTTARFATLYGAWFPNMRDDRAFGRAMVNQTLAQQAAMRRIRRVIPDAEFVLTEDLQRYAAGDAVVAEYVAFLRERVYLSVELVAGRVGEGHSLLPFLSERCGLNALELAMMQRDAAVPDLVAFNHYPHSERYLFTRGGEIADVPAVYVSGEPPPAVGPLLRAAAERLRLPLAIGEVHAHAPEAERVRWLLQHAADVNGLRADGVDVRALGAWAAFGMVDWHSLLRQRARVTEDGIYTFAGPTGIPLATAVATALRELAATGRIADTGVRGWWERDDRALPLEELIAMRDAGIPEGDHLRTIDEALA